MDNQIVVHQAAVVRQNHITPDVLDVVERLAPFVRKAGYFGVSTVEKAISVMLKGYELGLPYTTSFEFIVPIKDKLSLVPKGALALVQRSGLLESMDLVLNDSNVEDEISATVTMTRVNGSSFTRTWTVADAKRAGIYSDKDGSGWKSYPINMCQWRATGYVCDVLFADVTGGLYRYEELGGDITPEGDPIWHVENTEEAITLVHLLNEGYPMEDIITANGGSIPTDGEAERIYEVLKESSND